MDFSRNLLLGVLAKNSGRITQQQFADALALWSARGDVPLATVLCNRGWLSTADVDALDRAVDEKIREYDGDCRRALGAVADVQARNAIRDVEVDAVRETLIYLPPTDDFVRLESLDLPRQSKSRYTFTRVHGKGGISLIWLVYDRQLRREIALKTMRPESDSGATARERFAREAQVTGQLDHPNIVPVYELAVDEEDDSKPFYTMRFLRGGTLGGLIDAFHQQRTGRIDRIELAKLLGAFVGVCNAVAYAHSRGVVHRDLKPANIMIGSFGEVVVLDWGLAKLVDQPDELDERAIDAGSDSSLATQAGQVIGTPAYMSPEQADGRIELIDPRTDVYSLGGILFTILTGRPPHEGKDTMDLLRRIVLDPTPRPRAFDRSIPVPLDAVCAKAMAKKRADRYQEATDLAADVQRWLADEPVSVHADSWSVKLARLMRRHRAGTQAAAAALLVIAVVSVAAILVVNRARNAERLAKANAVQKFRDAREAIDESLTGVSGILEYYPGVQQARRRLLRKAAEEYARFAEEKSDVPEIQAESGRALIRLGNVHGLLDEWDEAEQSFRRAQAAFERLIADHPHVGDYRLELVNALVRSAFALDRLERREEAAQMYDRALAESARLVDADPLEPRYTHARGVALVNLAAFLERTGDLAAAQQRVTEAAALFEGLRDAVADPQYVDGHAATRKLQARIFNRQDRKLAAAALLREAIQDYRSLCREEPDQPRYVDGLAACHVELANMLRDLGRDREVLDAYVGAVADFELLVESLPDVPHFHENLAVTRTDLAQFVHKLGQTKRAQSELEGALASLIRLYDDADGSVRTRYQFEIAVCMTTLGGVLADLDQSEQARDYLREAELIFGELAQSQVADRRLRLHLAVCRSILARVLHTQGDAGAASVLETAIADFEQLAQVAADDGDSELAGQIRNGLVRCYFQQADQQFYEGKRDEARELYEQAKGLGTQLVQPEHRLNFARLIAGCPDEQIRDLQRTLAIALELTELSPQNARFWNLLGVVQYRNGNFDECAQALERARELRLHPDCMDGFFLAMANWQRGKTNLARTHFQRGVETMQEHRPGNVEADRIHREVLSLLEE